MPPTILIIDDERDLADTYARLLKAIGFDCVVAYRMEDAITLFDDRKPDIVLSDITLPSGDGFEIARYVRRKSPDTRVILMTGYHSANAETQAHQLANRYLKKPFPNSELISTVKGLAAGLGGSQP
jgi:DNA-binding response OmpR family regulator